MKADLINKNSKTKVMQLIQLAEEFTCTENIDTFNIIKQSAEVLLKNELGELNIHVIDLLALNSETSSLGDKLKTVLCEALEQIESRDKPKKEIKPKYIKTYCYNCVNETNQLVLFTDKEIEIKENICRNEQGDESQSMWVISANIWTISKCLGCEKINFKHILRPCSLENNDKIFYFPKKPIREIPKWVIKLPISYLEILNEVYRSINEELFILSLIGIRTLLDVYICNKIGDTGNFSQKLNSLVANGIITSSKAKVLKVTIEAGNASAHRGYKPDKDVLLQILDIVENLLQSEIVDRQETQIKQKTPPKK